jgi:hypothetical protein
MKNEYIAPEVIQVGNADKMILGNKIVGPPEFDMPYLPGNDLDD